MIAAAGSVVTQAKTILPAIFQRTAEKRRAAPTPTIVPVIVWVVETEMPPNVAMNKVIAPPVSAQNPCGGVSRVIFDPIRPLGFSIDEPKGGTCTYAASDKPLTISLQSPWYVCPLTAPTGQLCQQTFPAGATGTFEVKKKGRS